jgi:hypothetical protein
LGNDVSVASLHARALARGITIDRRVFASALASLQTGKHLLLFGDSKDACEGTAELIADEAADRGRTYGSLVLSAETASLLPLERILSEQHAQDFWIVLRRATPVALSRVIDELGSRSNANQRLLAVAAGAPGLALGNLSPAARRQLALIDLDGR